MTDYFLTTPARIKRAGAVKRYTVDLSRYLRRYWLPGHRYASTDYVRAPSLPGLAYKPDADGESGLTEPTWPRAIGLTAADGSLTWRGYATGDNGIDPISGSPVWAQINPPDSALLIGTQQNTSEETTAPFSGGTKGSIYRVRCSATTVAGDVWVTEFDLEID
jgi:hypothetical protein